MTNDCFLATVTQKGGQKPTKRLLSMEGIEPTTSTGQVPVRFLTFAFANY